MMARVVVVVGLWCALVAAPFAGADEPAASTSKDERIAALEAKLAEAKAEIERLKAELAEAKQGLPGGSEKPAKPAEKKKGDESADFFPEGTKVSGTFNGSNATTLATTGRVLSRSAAGMVLRLKNKNSTRDYDIRIKNGSAAIVAARLVDGDRKGSPIDINVSGKITADTLMLSGSWRTNGPRGSKAADVSFALKVN